MRRSLHASFVVAVLTLFVTSLALAASPCKHRKRHRRHHARAASFSRLPEAVAPDVRRAIDEGMRSGDMAVRGLAYYGLSMLPPAEGLDAAGIAKVLADGLRDPQPLVRLGAARGLLRLGRTERIDAALEGVLADPTMNLERDVFPVLHRLPRERAAAILAGVLANPKVKNRDAVAAVLFHRPDELTLAVVQRASKDAGVRKIVVEHVAAWPDWTAAKWLPRLVGGVHRDVALAVIERAGRLPKRVDIGFLAPLLHSKDTEVAQAAARVLCLRGDARAADVLVPLVEQLQGDELRELVRVIRHAAVKRHLAALEPLLDPLRKTPAAIVGEVWGAYAHAGDRSVSPQLAAALKGTHPAMRAAAARWLGAIDGSSALGQLRELLFDGSRDVRLAAARSLRDVASADAIDALVRALTDPDREVRRAVVDALAAIRDARVRDQMQFLVSDADPYVRRVAVVTLGAWRDNTIVPTLRVALGDADATVREEAVVALMNTDLASGREAFSSAIGGLDPSRVVAIAWRLGAHAYEPYAAIPLGHRLEAVRQAGVEALYVLDDALEPKVLRAAAAKTTWNDVKAAAWRRLAELEGAKVADLIRPIVADLNADAALRAEGVRLLGALGVVAALPELQVALGDGNESLKVSAAVALLEVHLPR